MTVHASDVARKIRALLDKAENTPFPAEAEAATRKAAELMAAHRISNAMLEAGAPQAADQITARVVELSRGPYVGARQSLLAGIAFAFGVRVVYTTHWHGRTVELFGYAGDLEAVEMLYTSLLLQATVAAGAESVPRGQSAVTWRRGFLVGFAETVEQRLREVMAEATADAERAARAAGAPSTRRTGADPTAPSVAVVLAERSARLDAEYRRRYGRLARGRGQAPVARGARERGAAAGARADLGRRRHVPFAPRALQRGG